MSFGVFNSGRDWILRKAFKNDFASSLISVGLYSNAQGSLSNRNVLADITPITGTGYAAISLSAAGWTSAIVLGTTNVDDVVRVNRAAEIFTATATWGTANGAYLFDASNSVAIAWKDSDVAYPMVNGAKFLADMLQDLI
jgi:hypothetical protein